LQRFESTIAIRVILSPAIVGCIYTTLATMSKEVEKPRRFMCKPESGALGMSYRRGTGAEGSGMKMKIRGVTNGHDGMELAKRLLSIGYRSYNAPR
jgi:hypothetical protein